LTKACTEATIYYGKKMLQKVARAPYVTLLLVGLPLRSDSRVQNTKNNGAKKRVLTV